MKPPDEGMPLHYRRHNDGTYKLIGLRLDRERR